MLIESNIKVEFTRVFMFRVSRVRILAQILATLTLYTRTYLIHQVSPSCPDRHHNLINIVRRIAKCVEAGKTDYVYKAMLNDSNLTRFWRCDNRIILLEMRFQYYLSFDGSCENVFLASLYPPSFPSFFMSSDFRTFHNFLLFPRLLSSSCFLLCISVACKNLFFSFHFSFLLFSVFLLSVFFPS
jgi:hypothetical protein